MATTTKTPAPTRQAKARPTGGRSAGRVQRLYVERGFGFIRCTEGAPDDLGQDFFFHYSGLACPIQELEEGETVTFTPTYVAKGKRAEEIERVGS